MAALKALQFLKAVPEISEEEAYRELLLDIAAEEGAPMEEIRLFGLPLDWQAIAEWVKDSHDLQDTETYLNSMVGRW